MILTNKLGLPDAIVRAVFSDDYSRGNADISATELIAPPQIRILRQQHDHEITEDVADRIWILLGRAVHYVIEKAAAPGELQEMRLFATCDGMKISGGLDLFALDTGEIIDFKVTSAWKILHGDYQDWCNQLMIYAWLVLESGGMFASAKVIAILRDWSEMKAGAGGYPEHAVELINLLGGGDTCKAALDAYVQGRVKIHRAAEAGDIAPCTDAERWMRPEKFAVMKEGRKSAVRVFDTRDEAEEKMSECGKNHYIEHRPGQSIRCERYCNVAAWCPQYNGGGNK